MGRKTYDFAPLSRVFTLRESVMTEAPKGQLEQATIQAFSVLKRPELFPQCMTLAKKIDDYARMQQAAGEEYGADLLADSWAEFLSDLLSEFGTQQQRSDNPPGL
jgi:hypothetical protein